MSSPYIAEIAGVAAGTLTGKAAVRAYWAAALEKMPSLSFEHVQTLIGADSVTIKNSYMASICKRALFNR